MPSILDISLSIGCIPAIGSTNGESVQILTGADQGIFFACNSIEEDRELILQTSLGDDPRAGWAIRFDPELPIPNITRGDRIKQDNGQVWEVVRRLNRTLAAANSGKTVDFEIKETVAGKDA